MECENLPGDDTGERILEKIRANKGSTTNDRINKYNEVTYVAESSSTAF